jgi:hypothetical protein
MNMFGLFSAMSETIDESVSVDLLSNHIKKRVYPWVVHWRGIRYLITKVGFHHMVREGRIVMHIFSVTDGNTFFKLKFNTETLGWRLLEIEHGI